MLKTHISVFFLLIISITSLFSQENEKQQKFPSISKDGTHRNDKDSCLNTKYPLPRSIYHSADNQENVLEQNISLDIKKPAKKTIFNSSYSKFIIPTILISYGGIARANARPILNFDQDVNDEVVKRKIRYRSIDDYMQYTPAIAVYGLSLAGIKSKHNLRDRTLIMATSYMAEAVMVQGLKRVTKIRRPDGSNSHSFPSGHTATTFVGAHMLFKEYKDVSPWLASSGYLVATTTGLFRILNCKHWVSDVVTGAGIGILSTEIGYMLLPVWHNVFGIKSQKQDLVIAPMIGTDNYGLGLAYRF